MRKVILVSMLVCCFGPVESVATVIYDFGGEFDIDFCVNDCVYIKDSSTGVPSTVNLLDGGCIDGAGVFDNSVFNMFGGMVGSYSVHPHDNSTAYICGGYIGGRLKMSGFGRLTIAGTDFNYPYGTYHNTTGYLTGHLLNGDDIGTDFSIYDFGTMTLIPEPATVLLLALGAVMLGKR